MSIDKFGRAMHDDANKKFRMELLHQQQQLAYTMDGDFDLQNRRLCNVKDPSNPQDCVTKQYSDKTLEEKIEKRDNELTESIGKASIIPLQEKITQLETTNKEDSKKLADINTFISRSQPVNDNHMATKKYVDEAIMKGTASILRFSLLDIEKSIALLDNKLEEVNSFISRHPPTAGKHMATKKYVDEAIVTSKEFIRSDIRNSVNKIRTDLLSVIEGKIKN